MVSLWELNDYTITQLTEQIRFDMDKGNYTGMVMIDLQKAFDTVDHDILLNKLKDIGLDVFSTYWFSSYLKNRFQKTEVDGIFSDPMVVPCGVPQKYIAESIFKKGNSKLKFPWRQAKYLKRNSRKLLATYLILCHFDYACSAWFEGLQVNLQNKLQILQNKTMRFVLGYPPRSHIGIEEFTLLHWIPVCQKG